MSYIWVPKDKNRRPSQDIAGKEDSTPALLVSQFNKNLSLGGSSSNSNRDSFKKNDKQMRRNIKFVYGNKATGMWFSVGLDNDYHIPSSLTLKEVSLTSFLRWGNQVPMVLVNGGNGEKNAATVKDGPRLKCPWTTIAENVLEDVVSSFHNLKREFNCQNLDELNPGFVVRFGKIIFHGNPSFNPCNYRKRAVSENALMKLFRNFYTIVPPSYVDNIRDNVVPEIGFDTKVEKESYRVKFSDSQQPDATITCECNVIAGGERIELYKIEMNQVRHLVVDVTCFGKDLDMRLMLRTKTIVNALSDNEMQSIRSLIGSAVLDSNVKGGLRWPTGMACHEQRFKVTAVWHSKCVSYKKSSMRLRIRAVNRFNYKASNEEFAQEVVLKLSGIISKLKEANHEDNSLFDILKNSFKVIWEHFLVCHEFLRPHQIL